MRGMRGFGRVSAVRASGFPWVVPSLSGVRLSWVSGVRACGFRGLCFLFPRVVP